MPNANSAATRQWAGGYSVAHLGDAAVAALTPLYQESQPVAWNVSFAVTDAAAARKVTEVGGTVLVGPMDVLDVGRFTVARDPAGAAFQLWQPRAFPGAGLFNAPGSLGWVELLTRAPERAEVFYTTGFGWSVNTSEQYTQWGLAGADFGGIRPASTALRQKPGAGAGAVPSARVEDGRPAGCRRTHRGHGCSAAPAAGVRAGLGGGTASRSGPHARRVGRRPKADAVSGTRARSSPVTVTRSRRGRTRQVDQAGCAGRRPGRGVRRR